jgi:hypothetical protein
MVLFGGAGGMGARGADVNAWVVVFVGSGGGGAEAEVGCGGEQVARDVFDGG